MPSPGKGRAQWNDDQDGFLIKHLLNATREGKKSDSGFKKDVMQDVAKKLNAKYAIKPAMTWLQCRTRSQNVSSSFLN